MVAGRKTETRRMGGLGEINEDPERWRMIGWLVRPSDKASLLVAGHFGGGIGVDHCGRIVALFVDPDGTSRRVPCPFGAPGDEWYSQEAHSLIDVMGCTRGTNIDTAKNIVYRADGGAFSLPCGYIPPTRWRSAMFQPAKFARLRRPIVSIGCERLDAITDEGAVAEGVGLNIGWGGVPEDVPEDFPSPSDLFVDLWERIYGSGAWMRMRRQFCWPIGLREADREEI